MSEPGFEEIMSKLESLEKHVLNLEKLIKNRLFNTRDRKNDNDSRQLDEADKLALRLLDRPKLHEFTFEEINEESTKQQKNWLKNG